MSEIVNFPSKSAPYGVDFVGPFAPEWRVTSGGYEVPHLTAVVKDDGTVSLLLDRRFIIDGGREEVSKWISFVADAMAVAAGYTCHGENSTKDPNPYRVRLTGLGEGPRS